MFKKIIIIVLYFILTIGCVYCQSSVIQSSQADEISRTCPETDRREGGSFPRAEARSEDDGVVTALRRGRATQPQAEEMTALPTSGFGTGSNIESLKKDDRILILAPHPDDETIGCAGIIQQAVKAGSDIHVVYLTNGDHNELAFIVYEKRLVFKKSGFIYMGRKRQAEAVKAVKSLGLNENNLIFLGYPDFGTFTIFKDFWQTNKPFKDILTRISSVPYIEDFSYGAPYTGESILADLERVLKLYRPNKIFVSHPADVNADHKALYLFLEVALSDLSKLLPRPKIYPYLIHCSGWPLPRHYHPELPLLPPGKFLNSQIQWFKYELNQEQLNKKYQAVLCHASQVKSSAFYLFSFVRKNELFGDYHEVQSIMLTANTAFNSKWPFWGGEEYKLQGSGISGMGDVTRIPLPLSRIQYLSENSEKKFSVDSGASWNERILKFFRSFNMFTPLDSKHPTGFTFLEEDSGIGQWLPHYKTDGGLESASAHTARPGRCLLSNRVKEGSFLTGFAEKTDNMNKTEEGYSKSAEVESNVVYGIEDKFFVIRINKKSGFSRRFSAMFYIFGYSYKMPFSQMPKIRIVNKYKRFRVFDGKKKIDSNGVTLDVVDRSLIVRVPLRIIGDPDFVFLSVKTSANALPIEATGFRKVNIKTE
ncbi:MAG: PIG-L family deacetylase [Candidatus Omnitrophota bacterium]